MKRDTEIALIERLLGHLEAGTTTMGPDETRIPVSSYRSAERFEAERRVLFRGSPILVAHSSEVAAPGDFFTHDALGVPLLVTRDREGVLRAFLNVCRHRGSRVALDERGASRKAFVCSYHGWTYGLDGGLMHIPHPTGFPRADCDRGLVSIPVEDRAGFVWVTPTPGPPANMNMKGFLGGLSDELDAFNLGQHTVYRTVSVRRRFNWKLIIDAFLDGYHLRQLHRSSVSRFFLDNVSDAESFGPHIRSAVARKSLVDVRARSRDEWHYRDVLSLTYFLFPNTVLVFHPDWVSRIAVFPDGVGESLFTHTMLVPPEGDTEDARPHWDKTWGLIHETVFEREDMAAAERIQSGLDSGANESFACGRYEAPIAWFHAAVEQALERDGSNGRKTADPGSI